MEPVTNGILCSDHDDVLERPSLVSFCNFVSRVFVARGTLPDKQNMAKYTKIQNPESRIQNACSGKSISLDEQLHLK